MRFEDENLRDTDNNFMTKFEKGENNAITFNTSQIKMEDEEDKKPTIHVLNEGGFMTTFSKRANDDFWKTVNII